MPPHGRCIAVIRQEGRRNHWKSRRIRRVPKRATAVSEKQKRSATAGWSTVACWYWPNYGQDLGGDFHLPSTQRETKAAPPSATELRFYLREADCIVLQFRQSIEELH